MSEEVKQAIEELVKVTEGNDLAKAFLNGLKNGMALTKAVLPTAPVTIDLEDSVPGKVIEPVELPEVVIPEDFDI